MSDQPAVYNEMHVKAILAMLPFAADQVAQLNVGLEINGKPVMKSDHHLPVGTVMSFNDADHHRVYYKLLAESNAQAKPTIYAGGHKAAAFVEVDKNGHEITDGKTGKEHIVITFPESTNPIKVTGVYNSAAATYQEAFFNRFVQTLATEFTKRGVSFSDVEVVSHGNGDKYALEYDARYGAQTFLISGRDKEQALIAAGTRNVLRDHLGGGLNDAQFNKEFATKVQNISSHVTQVDIEPLHEYINWGKSKLPEMAIGDICYKVKGQENTATYLNQKSQNITLANGADIATLVNQALDKSISFSLQDEHRPSLVSKSISASKAQEIFFIEVRNEWNAVGQEFAAEGKVTKREQSILSSFHDKIEELRARFMEHGVVDDQGLQSAANLYLKPVNKDQAKTPIR